MLFIISRHEKNQFVQKSHELYNYNTQSDVYLLMDSVCIFQLLRFATVVWLSMYSPFQLHSTSLYAWRQDGWLTSYMWLKINNCEVTTGSNNWLTMQNSVVYIMIGKSAHRDKSYWENIQSIFLSTQRWFNEM